jgi:hypothetical protein
MSNAIAHGDGAVGRLRGALGGAGDLLVVRGPLTCVLGSEIVGERN